VSASRGRRLLAAAIGFAMAALLFELVLRQVYWLPAADDPVFGNIALPGATVRVRTEGGGTSRWTERGIRRASPPAPAPAPILALGDSFTEALMIDDEDVFTNRLEGLLVEAGRPIPVWNAGRSGLSAADYVADAPAYQKAFAPRWVVIELRDDDLAAEAWDPGISHFARAPDGRLEAVSVRPRLGRFHALLQPLRQRSALVNYGMVRAREFAAAAAREAPLFRANAPAAPDGSGAPHDASQYPIGEELEAMQRAYGGRVTFLYLPHFDLAAPATPTSTAERVFRERCERGAWSCVDLRAAFPAFAARLESPFGFSNSAWNQGHMNAAGHHAAALLLRDEMLRLSDRGLL